MIISKKTSAAPPSSRSSGIMKTKARLLGMQAYSWRQYKVGCA
jgi:hypothetical protein